MNKKQRNKLFTMLLLVMAWLIPQWGWAQTYQPEGSGTSEDPFVITSAEELAWFRDYVNNGNSYVDAKIADEVEVIDMKSVCHEATSEATEQSWTPIGSYNCEYGGTFDGNGKVIKNLYINSSEQYLGLFGYVYNGSIKNITFENAHVVNTRVSNTGILAGHCGSDTGILAGHCGSELHNIKVLSSCSVRGHDYSGGIVGYVIFTEISNCENWGTVNGADFVGGLSGGGLNTITSCANYGNVTGTYCVGGIVGDFHEETILDCANYGKINGTDCVGGMIGMTTDTKVKNLLSYGDVESSRTRRGVVIGCINSELNGDGIIAYNNEALLNGESATGKVVGVGSFTVADGKSEADVVKPFTKAQLASGEVAWLLNGSTATPAEGETLAWYQKLGNDGDAYPVLKATGDNTVYRTYHHGEKDLSYSNLVEHSTAYNDEADDEANGNHDMSYQAGEYTWTKITNKEEMPSVTVTYTCKVCGKTETPSMSVEYDEDHENVEETCTTAGHYYFKTTRKFNDKAVFSGINDQELPALGHDMQDDITFDSNKYIYQKGCKRDCGYHEYFATSDGSIEAESNEDESEFTVAELTLNDGTKYDSKAKFTVKELTYNRSFDLYGWEPMYVPFDFNYSQLKGYEVATINNFHEYVMEDGSTKTDLEVRKVADTGDPIAALTPFLIRKTDETASEIKIQDAQFVPAADKSIDCASVSRYYQFFGTLEGKDGFDASCEFYLNEDGLVKANSDAQLKPLRWYLRTTDRNNGGLLNPESQFSRIGIRMIGGGDDVTGIEDIYVKTDKGEAGANKQGIYDLQGRKLSQEPKSGVYIKNGKKYVK